MKYIFLCVLLFCNESSSIFASTLSLVSKVSELDLEGPVLIEGTLTLEEVRNDEHFQKEQCFYLAYEDSDYPHNINSISRFLGTSQRTSSPYMRAGYMDVQALPDSANSIEYLSASVIKVTRKKGIDLKLAFKATPKTVNSKTRDLVLFDFFYPIPLKHCDEPFNESTIAEHILPLPTSYQITYPAKYRFAGTGVNNAETQGELELRQGGVNSQRLAFALLSSRYEETTYKVANHDLKISYRNQDIAHLGVHAPELLENLIEFNGNLPWDPIHVIEVDYPERDDIPGLIFIAHPSQKTLASLQFRFTKWGLWNLANRLARQWWGSLVVSRNYENDWFNLGMSDWSADLALKRMSHIHANELFNDELGFFSLTHSQYLNMLAATLNRQDPYSYLYNYQEDQIQNANLQAPTLFIKQTLAMRYFLAQVGEMQTLRFLRSFLKYHTNQTIISEDFLNYFDVQPSVFPLKERQAAKSTMKSYWLSTGFPDFSIKNLSSKKNPDGTWNTDFDFSVTNHNALKIPVRLTDSKKNQIHLMLDPSGKEAGSEFDQSVRGIVTEHKIEKMVIDPDYIYFDPDRFDNTTSIPTVHFFPGNFRTLSDHHYSVFWLPYFFRRPGEPFSIGTSFSAMKYTQPLLFGSLEYAPSEKATAYSLSSEQKTSFFRGLKSEIRLAKNYENTQSASISFEQSPLARALPLFSLNLSFSHQRQLGNPDSAHFVAGLGLMLDSKKTLRNCGIRFSVAPEISPKIGSQSFSYQKTNVQLASECQFLRHFAFRTKQFYGRLHGEGEVPETVAFKINDLRSIGHRIDLRNLPRLNDVFSTIQDVYAPIPFLEGSTGFLLLNRLKLRGFYDLAFEPNAPQALYRAAGTGLTLPFGGGVTGVGDLAFLRFSALAVLYASTPESKNRRPSFLFDFSGEL